MQLKKYKVCYLDEMISLFYDTVHFINSKDYTKKQIDAWAPEDTDAMKWNEKFLNSYTIIAFQDEKIIGFGNIDDSGYLDMLYVHKNYQNQKIASVICDNLEKYFYDNVLCDKKPFITVHSSITAKGFFKKRGYIPIKKQKVTRKGQLLVNFIMKKTF